MAQKPSKADGIKLSNIMNYTRGFFDFKTPKEEPVTTQGFGSAELISADLKSKLLSGSLRQMESSPNRANNPVNSLSMLASGTYAKVGQERLDNRRILELMPEIGKAARLMVASIFSPNDLTRQEIAVQFGVEHIDTALQAKLTKAATDFFQKKLNLKTSAASWVYQFGYETGAAVFAIIPTTAVAKIQEESYLGTETFVTKILEPLGHESLFGFGDSEHYLSDYRHDVSGLESLGKQELVRINDLHDKSELDTRAPAFAKELIEKFIGHEALNLTDNPSVLKTSHTANDLRKKRSKDKLRRRYKTAVDEMLVEIDGQQTEGEVEGNPLFLRLPPESVTVIHTPGDPSDHQGYLVLLDLMGNPVNIVSQEQMGVEDSAIYKNSQSNLFSQIHQAYGMNKNNRSLLDQRTMEQIYTKVVGQHLGKRLDKAGFSNVEIPQLDSTLRYMFSRLLEEKKTRLLFLPKELVTYMTFETDQNGYGVSKLNGIKFALGMKMAVQVSRVLASIKAAMDKRKITMKFDSSMMEQPESVFETMIQQYIQKSVMSFSTDPGYIQSQIAQKSFSVAAEGLPGMDAFSVSNEADNKSSASDFDSGMVDYLDKVIIQGMDVPASTMNSLNEDEYARSVTTTNLFFAMTVGIHQDIVIKLISDLLRKYALYSKEFQLELLEILPQLRNKKGKGNSSTDETAQDDDKDTNALPEGTTLESLIESLTISLPKPNIAPSKAQFESLESMISAMTNMTTSLFPDELTGPDDKLRSVIALLRARYSAENIRAYMANVGMTGIDVPSHDIGKQMGEISGLQNMLYNLAAMLEDRSKLVQPTTVDNTAVPGY